LRRAVDFPRFALDFFCDIAIIPLTNRETVTNQRGATVSGPVNGPYIKRLRETAGIAQYILAAKLGVPQSVLSEWETGRRAMPEADQARAQATVKALVAEREADIADVLREAR
jgi:predicted transcriptional regulator